MRCTNCYHDGALAIGARILGGEYQIAVTNEDDVDVAVVTLSREEALDLGTMLVRWQDAHRIGLRYAGLAIECRGGFDDASLIFSNGVRINLDEDEAESFGIDLIRLTARAA